MMRTDVQEQCRIIRRCCCCSLTTAKRCRSCWSFRVVHFVIFPCTASKSADRVPPYGRTYFFPLNITAYEVLPPNNRLFYSLDTPNWAKKSVPTHGVYASLPPSWLYTAYTVPIVQGFPTHSIASRPNQLKSISKQSNQVGRINLEPSQATASMHWSPHSVRVRVQVEWL